MIFVPDLEDVRPTMDVLYESPSGPICGLDMFYGKKSFVEDSLWMSHHTGFIRDTLKRCMEKAGFTEVTVQRLENFSLFGAGKKCS